MATDVQKVEFMTKRSVMKSRFKREDYKGRWFVLTSNKLSYYEGKDGPASVIPDSNKKLKGWIPLTNVKVIETIEPEYLSNHLNAFQVMYVDDPSGENYTLYIVPITRESRDEWISTLREAAIKCNVTPAKKYHTGAYSFRDRRWICCEKIQKKADGCMNATWDSTPYQPPTKASTPPSPSKEPNNNATPPKPPERPSALPPPPVEVKETVIAMYDYQKSEKDDLGLEKGETYDILDKDQQYWWKARNKDGVVGFIPANYVKTMEGDQLEQYDWYYPTISRTQSEDILRKEGKEGCFLLRASSMKGMYTLSIFAKDSGEGVVKHYHIKMKGNGEYYLTERHAFSTIPELINYHKHNSAGLIVRLRSSPQRGSGSDMAPATSGLGHDKYEIDPSELELKEDLGAGQFGTVKLALWKGQKQVAVKMMKEDAMSEDDFIDEAKTMRDLKHRNLVQLYGVSTKKRPLYIITEYMRHGSLLSYLRRHKTRLFKKVPTLMDMCFQVSEAMEYLESQSFIHRDLAARNCLVGEGDVCKVGDFGLARFVIDDEYSASQGTKFPIRWAPPEVLSYTRFSTKSDVWSFGILMWEIFTGGDLPYGRVKNQDVVKQVCHLSKRLDCPNKCPEEMYEIMLACWEEDPGKRPDFAYIRDNLQNSLRFGYEGEICS